MNYETFEKICKMTQKALKAHVTRELAQAYPNKVYAGDGYVYAQGEFPVLLVAHLDTVHKKLPKVIFYEEKNDSYSSPYGIGGDDRCGVYMIFEVIKRFNCSVLFCEDEEVGGIGAKKFASTDLAKELEFNYAIEFDRRGRNDAVFYDCDNQDFEDFVTKEFYKTAYGSFSDICTVAPVLKCAAVNLSCGYYNAHTEQEYVIAREMDASIEAACNLLARTTDKDKFEYIEATYTYRGWAYGGWHHNGCGYSKANTYRNYQTAESDTYEEEDFLNYYMIEFTNEKGKTDWFDTYAVSEAEAVGRLLTWHPTLCYGNIIDIMVDRGY
jgi:hypothetical protein